MYIVWMLWCLGLVHISTSSDPAVAVTWCKAHKSRKYCIHIFWVNKSLNQWIISSQVGFNLEKHSSIGMMSGEWGSSNVLNEGHNLSTWWIAALSITTTFMDLYGWMASSKEGGIFQCSIKICLYLLWVVMWTSSIPSMIMPAIVESLLHFTNSLLDTARPFRA